jgi:predicted alpha/beta-hydrolase family hydrolase
VPLHPASPLDAPLLVLAHGAGAGERHPWMQRVAGGLVARQVAVYTFDFPYMAAGRKYPDRGPALEAAFAEAWRDAVWQTAAAGLQPRAFFAGGKSMGGRIATQVAARDGLAPHPAGVICFGYPLHPPGRPDGRRDAHLPSLLCPVLFLQGTRDPFATPDEMRTVVSTLDEATLWLADGGDHSLERGRNKADQPLLDAALDTAAMWIKGRHEH